MGLGKNLSDKIKPYLNERTNLDTMIALDFSTFMGRFHPILVHLPIGFLVLAILLEWYEHFKKTTSKSKLIPFAWLLGAISAAAAASSGWLLGETGLYTEEGLFTHRWLGIAVVIVAFIGWWLKKSPDNYSNKLQNGFNILLLGMLLFEGHKGGNLTHGEDYLIEYAPNAIQKLAGASDTKDSLYAFKSIDSVNVYAHLIAPIFEAKCVACHNSEVQRGGLNMALPDGLAMGGENGPILAKGNPTESTLFNRITLPQRNIKFMPPSGEAMTYDEIKLVEWWIQEGASFNDSLPGFQLNDAMKSVLLRKYGLDTKPKPWYEMVSLEPLEEGILKALEEAGFVIKELGDTNHLLDVKFSGQPLTREKLVLLEKAASHITWLSMAGSDVKDEWLSSLGILKNLTRLQLEKTEITDAGIGHLTGLKHLEALNLYGTKVTDACLQDIQKLKTLRRVYVWGTKVTPEAAKKLQEEYRDFELVLGAN